MSAAFHVRADDNQRPGDRTRLSVLMVMVFRCLTKCVILECDYGDIERESEENRRYLRQGECNCLSPAYLSHDNFMRFKVVELEERAGRMCLRFETAKTVHSVDVDRRLRQRSRQM